MKYSHYKYAQIAQHKVTTLHEDENGSHQLHIASGSGDSPSLDDDLNDSPQEGVDFRDYKKTSYNCCLRRRIFCGRFSQSLTSCELFLSLLVAFLTIIIIYLAARHGNQEGCHGNSGIANSTNDICITRSCVQVASRISLSLDESVEPCDDFYQFACGGWVKRNPLPAGHARWGTFDDLWQQNQAFLKSLLESNSTKDTSQSEHKARLYYKSCLNMEAINKLGASPLTDLIHKLGGMPLLSNWNESEFDFNENLLKLAPYSMFPFFSIDVGTDSKHSNSNIITISEVGLGLGSRHYYLNKTVEQDRILGAYLTYLTDIGILLGGDANRTREDMKEYINLEREIAEIMLPLEKLRDEESNYFRFNLTQLKEFADVVNWDPLIQALFKGLANITINGSEPMTTSSIGYIKSFSKIVKKTSKRVLANYAMMRFSQLFISVLSQNFIDVENKMHKVKYGSDLSCWERWLDCVKMVDMSLGKALGRLFIQKRFDTSSKQSAGEMVDYIKSAFNRTLNGIKWMDEVTKVKASAKAEAVEDMIGFPDIILNVTYVDEQYKDLDIQEGQTYFEQHDNFMKFVVSKQLKALREPVKRNEWSMTPPTVNAYYSPNKNVIVFPAGILQPPFYSSNYPKSINFGGIGIVVGHELTHGFDDQGRQYDLHGNLFNWWENETLENFKENAKCMIDQYAGYEVGGNHLNGNLTIGENIADNGGLSLAHDAYLNWRKNNPRISNKLDPLLPSLNFTHDQLFYIAFAQLWCSASTPQYDKQSILSNVHSPGRYRVIGSVSNSQQFADAFQCPRGSPMNPTHKCKVW